MENESSIKRNLSPINDLQKMLYTTQMDDKLNDVSLHYVHYIYEILLIFDICRWNLTTQKINHLKIFIYLKRKDKYVYYRNYFKFENNILICII